MTTPIPAVYREISSHFKNKYALSTGYSNMSQGLSDALDAFCQIVDIKPSALGLWQGCWNPHGPKTSAGYHTYANAADLVLPASSKVDEWVKTLSYIGIGGWKRDLSHGGFSTPHLHVFALYMKNAKYVSDGIIGQQREYLAGGDGLVGTGKDYHAALRPDIKTVHFLGKTASPKATVTKNTHSYTQPGKIAKHQDAARKTGYKITNAVCTVRVWQGDKHTDMLVTEGRRFYDLAKVKLG